MRNLIFILLLCLYADYSHAKDTPYYHFNQLAARQGLPTSITSLCSDRKGLLWIGTPRGVYSFNGERTRKHGLPQSVGQETHYINELSCDYQNRIWVITANGVSFFTYENDSLQTFMRNGRPVRCNDVGIEQDRLFFPVRDSLLIYDRQLQESRAVPMGDGAEYILQMTEYDSRYYLILNEYWKLKLLDKHTGNILPSPFEDIADIHCFYKDSAGNFWISPYGKGVKCYTPDGKLLADYNTGNSAMNNGVVLHIEEWDKNIWLATDGGGINIIYPETGTIEVLSSHNNHRFPANSVSCLWQVSNCMWIGMVRAGVLEVKKGFITTYTKEMKEQGTGMSEDCPLCLWEDEDGRIWIGTDGGGINSFEPKTEKFTHYPDTQGEKIVSFCPLSKDELLVSSFSKGLYRFNKRTGTYKRFFLPDKKVDSVIANSGAPTNLYVNEKGEIGIYGESVFRYSFDKNQLMPVNHNLSRVNPSWVYIGGYRNSSFFCDRNNIIRYDRETGKYTLFDELSRTQILAANVDCRGNLWIATPNGVRRINLSTGYKEKIKLPNNGNDVITSLVADREGIVWMGALGLIYAYDTRKNNFVVYNEMDGVLPNDFLPKPIWVTEDGNVYMGGSEGLICINKSLKNDFQPSLLDLQLGDVLIDGTYVSPDENNHKLEVNNHFSSLQLYVQSEDVSMFHKHIYRFRIRGLDEEYMETSHPYLFLHTIPSGNYRITVQYIQNDGVWSREFGLLNLIVLPPWWLQPWFIALSVIVVAFLVIYIVWRHEQWLQQKLKEEERENYRNKVKSLININHELRTPLTLIYAPLKQLASDRQVPYELRTSLQGIFKQARQMKNIIDMILNMRRMEVEKNILHMSPQVFNEWLQNIVEDFRDEFNRRNIELSLTLDPAIQTMYFDVNQCGIIVNNLLTNAYKFSDENSKIFIVTRLEANGNYVRVTVKDENTTLRQEDISNLLVRFQEGNHSIQGFGIGLPYAKQLVEMHGGMMGAENNEGKGTSFFFTLPYRQGAASIQSKPQTFLNHIEAGGLLQASRATDYKEKFHSVLIVEKDRDLCNYLRSNLQTWFEEIYEAHDGMEALPVITTRLPQIVISSVKMPRMNGFELCRNIKQNPKLSYIPVILLTAFVDESAMEEGYRLGAEAYIAKPFDMELLSIQIRNILHNRNTIKRHYATLDPPVPLQKNLNHVNEHLLLELNRIINENIGNADMDVNFIAHEMGMSRASLYNKTKGIMETGISEYILKCRLNHARRLLEATTLSISEVAEQAGFKHARNFSTLFKNASGVTPSEFRKQFAE